MALKSTIFKAVLSIADIDRGYYGDHALTIARHPSETDERMMVRLLAFALHADDALEFGRGLSEASRALAQLAARHMRLKVTIQEGHVFVADDATSVPVEIRMLKALSNAR